jgi:uncharacterized protein
VSALANPARPAFHLLVKPAGAACNLACSYCFYLDKEKLYPGRRLRMSETVLEAYISQLLEAQQTPEVSVSWQGGEPTLVGLEFYKRSIELVEKYRRPWQNVAYTLQTNGTHLDNEWCAFFRKHNFLIGLSVDGPPEMHDAYRLDKGGQGTFAQVRRGWDLLQKHGVETNILGAVHAANAPYPLEVYRFFRDDLRSQFIQFIPIVERLTNAESPQAGQGQHELSGNKRRRHRRESALVSPRSVKSGQFGNFLIAVFDEWVRRDVGSVFVQTFDSALASWCRLPPSVCIFQETCGNALVLEHNGDLYSCDHFVTPDYRLGNVNETPLRTLVSSIHQQQFGLDKRERLPGYCRTCDVLFACRGECPRNRFIHTPDGEEGLNYLCAGYRSFFHHVDRPMSIMADLLRRGIMPMEIMRRQR